MMPRTAGAALGLLAFTIVLVGGVITQNAATVTLSRGLIALFLFFFIGLALGAAAQRVVAEYEQKRTEELNSRPSAGADSAPAGEGPPESSGSTRAPIVA